jgi:hypothetical protein
MKILTNYAVVPLIVLSYGLLEASNVATQTVTFSVAPISEIAFSGDPSPMINYQAIAGNDPTSAFEDSTFYAVTTNGVSEKVVACLNSPMPTGTMLCIMVGAPNGAVSAGTVDLTTSNQNVVTGITQVAQSSLPVSYTFESSTSAGIIPITTRIVTFTLSP